MANKSNDMEEPEVPLEHVQEEMHHHAQHGNERWPLWVALTSALLAALAAVTSLLAGHHSNEAMIDQIQAANQWNYYQAKGIKANLLSAKLDLLDAEGKATDSKDKEKMAQYKEDQEAIKQKAEAKERSSEKHLHCHVIFARGVTMFQVAIAVAAISVLTGRRRFWNVSLIFGGLGVCFLIQGLLTH